MEHAYEENRHVHQTAPYSSIEQMPGVQMSSVLTDAKKPFLHTSTRWDYISKYFDIWKDSVRFRAYALACLGLGLYLLFTIPIMGVVALAGAAYYWELVKFRRHRLESERSVMIGH
ncbi:MAG: hypothetical protein V1787_02370 [Candidatus Micrarchaeota archaeon]